MDELIVFIKEEERNNKGQSEKFSEALDYLESLSLVCRACPEIL